MAAALFNRAVSPAEGLGISAGTSPGPCVHPEVVTVMREVGIDLADAAPRELTDDLARRADVLVTMGCGDACPLVPGARVEDWPIRDPKGQPVEIVRAIRDGIERRVEDLIARQGLSRRA